MDSIWIRNEQISPVRDEARLVIGLKFYFLHDFTLAFS